jgi:hypothetical protein
VSCNVIDQAMNPVQWVEADTGISLCWVPSRRWLIGGLALIVLVVSGIGAVMAWAPNPIEVTGDHVVVGQPPVRPSVDNPVGPRCQECGVVESSRMVIRDPVGTDRDAPMPLTASRRNEMSDQSVRVSEVTVRMSDGTSRQFVDANLPRWRSGERMVFIDGVSSSGR